MAFRAAVTQSGAGPSDAALVVSAAAGERWAQEALYRRYARMVNGLSFRLIPNSADSTDLAQDAFVEQMLQWLEAFVPKPGQTIPGVSDLEFAKIQVPTLIFRSGENDWDHPKRTSFEVHTLIKGSAMAEPPWPEDAWEVNSAANAAGTGHRFAPWVLAAPQLLDFIHEGKVTHPTFAGPNA